MAGLEVQAAALPAEAPDSPGGLGTIPRLGSAQAPREGSAWPPSVSRSAPPTYTLPPLHSHPHTPAHTRLPSPHSTGRNVETAHGRFRRAAAADEVSQTRMRRKLAVPDASQPQPGRGGGGAEPQTEAAVARETQAGGGEPGTCRLPAPPPTRCAGAPQPPPPLLPPLRRSHTCTYVCHTLIPPHCRGRTPQPAELAGTSTCGYPGSQAGPWSHWDCPSCPVWAPGVEVLLGVAPPAQRRASSWSFRV